MTSEEKLEKDKDYWDFDGYDHDKLGISMDEAINDPNRIMGHAFVLKMMLLKDVGEL